MPEPTGRIVVSGLTKSFGQVRAVDDLNFTVELGSVTAFLGPNGAGKTTTLRMLLGLVTPDRGAATIGGHSYRRLPRPSTTVGAALEATGFHPYRTGRNHLRVYCTINGYPQTRADEVLDLVGLTGAARRVVRGYSLGMRQRLAVAAAPLGDRRYWSSTNQPTAWTPRASCEYAACCGTWPSRDAPCWCPATC